MNLVAAISDNGGDALSFGGGGELILSGSNSYTGGTTVLSGTLDLTSPAALPGIGVLIVSSGASVITQSSSLGVEALPGGALPMVADPVASVPEPSALLLLIVGARSGGLCLAGKAVAVDRWWGSPTKLRSTRVGPLYFLSG